MQHTRNLSNVSAPESEISSSGTFIDKGSLEEVSKDERSERDMALAHVSESVPLTGTVSKSVQPKYEEQLQPPESAFSASDLSEQLSGAVP